MSNVGVNSFRTTLEETTRIINLLETELGWERRREETIGLLKASVQALRDRLPLNHAVQLGSELTALMRGFYYENWNPDRVPLKYNRAQFLDLVRKNFAHSTNEKFDEMVQATLTTTMKSVSPEIHQQIKEILPEEIAKLLG